MKDKLVYLICLIIVIIIIISSIIIFLYKKTENEDNNDISYVQESGGEYNSSQLNNFNFELVNMNEEVIKKIKEPDKFRKYMKEYLYKNGKIEADKAEYLSYRTDNNFLVIKFKLNDKNETRIIAKIDISSDTYEFIVY